MLKRLLVNTSSNMLVLLVKIALTFIMTPIFLINMGNYDYGVWAIIANVVGYMGILDIGIKPAIIRFTAKYRAESDQESLRIMYSSSLVFTIFIGIFISLSLITWGVYFPESIAPNNSDSTKYTLVLVIIALQMLIVFPGYVPVSYIEGYQKYNIKNNITIINSILGSLIIYIYISEDNALYLVALINAIGLSSKHIFYFYVLTRDTFGNLYPNVKNASLFKIKTLLKFGGKSFIQSVSYRIANFTDILVIGYFLGPAVIPFYSIPANLIGHIKNVGFTLTQAFMPQFSELAAKGNKESIADLYINSSKWVIAIIMPISIVAVVIGPSFITLWIGAEYGENSGTILLLFVLLTVIPFLDPMKSRFLTAINKHGILAKYFPIAALINVVLSIIFIQFYGLIGVIVGSLIPVFIFMPIYLKYSCSLLNITVKSYIFNAVIPNLMPNILLILSLLFTEYIVNIDGYFVLVTACLANLIPYMFFGWLITLNKREKHTIKLKVRGLINAKN